MTILVPFNMFQSSAMRKGLVYDPYKKCMSYGVKILNSDYKRQNGSSCIRNFIKCCEVVRNSAKKKRKLQNSIVNLVSTFLYQQEIMMCISH